MLKRRQGVEVNPAALNEARQRLPVVVTSTDELEADYYDIVISNHALEHTLEPFRVLSGLQRILRPGGSLVLHLPINDWRNDRDLSKPDPSHHMYTWTPLLIRNLLDEVGLMTSTARVVNYGEVGRLTPYLASRLSPRAYDFASAVTAILRRRRELRVVAVKPGSAS
jgi:SAM-dependent methyltransferase